MLTLGMPSVTTKSPSPIEQAFVQAPTTFCANFNSQGYAVLRGLATPSQCAEMLELAQRDLAAHTPPLEYEADLHYPGSPPSREAPGGKTVRRLLQIYARSPIFQNWARNPDVLTHVRHVLGPNICLVQAHHNCMMTKQPGYSSDTPWHQDIRYWRFQRPELVTVWLALGSEFPANGGLHVLPVSHRSNVSATQLDAKQFLRSDLPDNQKIISTQIPIELALGDVLFFHSRTFHAASRNRSSQAKFSLVFTYRAADNLPIPQSPSASLPDIAML